MSKFRNRPTTRNGIRFDSEGEANRYMELKLLEAGQYISDLKIQPVFVLLEKFTDSAGNKHAAIRYRADFSYIDNGQRVVEDFKGVETEVFRIKRKMFLSRYPDIDFRITKAR